MSDRYEWRHAVLFWMEEHNWPVNHARKYLFWDWVIMPRTWGSRYGFKHWLRWATRGKEMEATSHIEDSSK